MQAQQSTTPPPQGVFNGRIYDLPEGFVLKSDVEYSTDIGRYLWHPKKGDFVWFPNLNAIYEYRKWKDSIEGRIGGLTAMDGFALIRELGKKRGHWIYNVGVRHGIPLQKTNNPQQVGE